MSDEIALQVRDRTVWGEWRRLAAYGGVLVGDGIEHISGLVNPGPVRDGQTPALGPIRRIRARNKNAGFRDSLCQKRLVGSTCAFPGTHRGDYGVSSDLAVTLPPTFGLSKGETMSDEQSVGGEGHDPDQDDDLNRYLIDEKAAASRWEKMNDLLEAISDWRTLVEFVEFVDQRTENRALESFYSEAHYGYEVAQHRVRGLLRELAEWAPNASPSRPTVGYSPARDRSSS